MALDELADSLTAARFTTAERGYAPSEVDDLLVRAASALRLAHAADQILAVADMLESATFTPVPGGYEPFSVRGALTRAISDVRVAADNGAARGPAGVVEPAPSIEYLGVDSELRRLEAYEHELADRLARLAQPDDGGDVTVELRRLREEIRVAGATLRDLVRQVSMLRRKAREELVLELTEIRRRWLADLADEVAERVRRDAPASPPPRLPHDEG